MRQVTGLTATYSSDEFGICSALYELGGMVVMHDASGCNSTYTTHDEPRWYEMDSMIYISAISEMEAIMGDDEKLIADLVETAQQLQPAFIAIVGAPIPYMIGTDLEAIASVVEAQTQIPAFGFAANGMNGYQTGISMALKALVQRFCTDQIDRADQMTVNILGATPLDFSLNGSVESIRQWILDHGMQPGVCMAMGSTLEEIRRAGNAWVNLVVSYGGLAAAREMEMRFGIPYVVGVPIGKDFSDYLAEQLKETAESKTSVVGYLEFSKEDKFDILSKVSEPLAVIGESVFGASLAAAITSESGQACTLLCPMETEEALLRPGDLQTPEEDDLLRILREHRDEQECCANHTFLFSGVIADPLYQTLCPEGMAFYPFGHIAFSGRLYEKEIPNLIDRSLRQIKQGEEKK